MLTPIQESLQQGLESGLHIGAQLFIAHRGEILLNEAVGLASLEHNTPMTPSTLMLWLSAGKPITAVAIAILLDRNLLSLDDTVASHIPEFAAHGKETITLRHLLTHTAGIRALDTQYPFLTWHETLEKLCNLKPERDWTPGQKAGYHAHSSWYILGEVIQRIDGRPIHQFLRDEILLPLGMKDSHLAMDEPTYHAYGPRIGQLHDTTASPPKPIPNYDTPLAASRPRPSASMRGPMHDLALFYEMLHHHGQIPGGTRILQPHTAQLLTSRHRIALFDHSFKQTIDWGLGIILNSSHYGPGIPYQFGPHASPNTFGHGGSQSSVGFCDPHHHLIITALFNGCPGEPAHDRRLRTLLKIIYESLGLAGTLPS